MSCMLLEVKTEDH